MTDQTNTTAAAPATDDAAADAQFRSTVHSRVRAGLQQTIARIAETNSATLQAQGKQAPVQGRTISNQGGRSVKLNPDGTFSHTVTHGTVDDSGSPGLTAGASRQSETSLANKMTAINKTITDSQYYDSKTGQGKTHLTDEQYNKLGIEYQMLQRAYEAQTRTTAELEAREAHDEQLKQRAMEREQAIRAFGNGDPAREKALRNHLADLEAAEMAAMTL